MSHKPTPYEAAKQYLGCSPNEAFRAADVEPPDSEALRKLLERLWIGLHALKVRPAPQLRWQHKMRAQGRCVTCGAPSWRPGSHYCPDHRRTAPVKETG